MPQYTFNDMFDRFVKEKLPLRAKRTQADYQYHLVTLRKHFGPRIASELTLDDMNAFMDVERGKGARNRTMAVMSSALQSAVKWRWLDYNIAKEVTRHAAKPRKRLVSDKEISGIKQKVSHPQVKLAIDLTRLTGLRQGTLVELRWDQVHENERVILARHHVTGKRIEVPITDEVRAVLAKCRELRLKTDSEYVIANRQGEAYTSAGFRALWQRTINRWTRGGHDRFTFNDITMTALRERKRLSAAPQQGEEDYTVAGFSEFDAVVRTEATTMAQHYKVFYCLEKSIRMMISDAMRTAYGADWWNTKIDPTIKQKAENVLGMEIDSGLPQRSDAMIDYTTFGQLRQIISQHWADVFAKKLSTEKAVSNVMTNLNRIRGPIAHFSPMSDHDVERLKFSVAEWFNLLLEKD
jgi:site-specific recombinase XerD